MGYYNSSARQCGTGAGGAPAFYSYSLIVSGVLPHSPIVPAFLLYGRVPMSWSLVLKMFTVHGLHGLTVTQKAVDICTYMYNSSSLIHPCSAQNGLSEHLQPQWNGGIKLCYRTHYAFKDVTFSYFELKREKKQKEKKGWQNLLILRNIL